MKTNIFLFIALVLGALAGALWYNWDLFSSYDDSWRNNSILLISAIVALSTYLLVIFVNSVGVKSKQEKWLRLSLIFIMILVTFFLRNAEISLGMLFEYCIKGTSAWLASCHQYVNLDVWYCEWGIADYERFVYLAKGIAAALVAALLIFYIRKCCFKSRHMSSRFVILTHSFLLLGIVELFILTLDNYTSLIYINAICYTLALLVIFTSDQGEADEVSAEKVIDAPVLEEAEAELQQEANDKSEPEDKKSDSTDKDIPWSV